MNITFVKVLFVVAAIYDGLIGVTGLLFPGLAFEVFAVTPPNHFGYVQFPAALLLVFAAMFYRVARDPISNRFLMLYGIALKAAYSGIVFYYMVATGIPTMWVPWAWVDLAFLVLFYMSWLYTRQFAIRGATTP